LLSIVSGNTPEARSRALDVLLRAAPGAVVLSISVQSDPDGRYPFVQRVVSCDDERLRDELCRAATGDPAVIIRQDLADIARRTARPHVVLALPDNLDTVRFLTALWQTPLGHTPMSHYYDLAPIAVGVDPERFLSDLRCAHRAADLFGAGAHAIRVTLAEAAARHAEAAGVVVLGPGQNTADGRREGTRALLAHLNPSAMVHSGAEVDEAVPAALTRPDPQWAAAAPVDRLDPVTAPVYRRGDDRGVTSVLWRSRRPVHPGRLAESLPRIMSGLLRSRGHLWLATRPQSVVSWLSAGRHLELREAGTWLQDGDPSAWRDASPQRRTLASWFWDDYYGERRNEIVFTGADLDEDWLRGILDATLLDDGDLARGAEGWADLPDPLLGTAQSDAPTER
jgi:G3E family GTPase